MKKRIPIVVLRSLETGGFGWSHPASLTTERFQAVHRKLADVVKDSHGARFAIRCDDSKRSEWLVGYREPDRECIDPRARTRSPIVIRAAVVDHRPSCHDASEIVGRIARSKLPLMHGPQDKGLVIEFDFRDIPEVSVKQPLRSVISVDEYEAANGGALVDFMDYCLPNHLSRTATSNPGAAVAFLLILLSILIPWIHDGLANGRGTVQAGCLALACLAFYVFAPRSVTIKEIERGEDEWDGWVKRCTQAQLLARLVDEETVPTEEDSSALTFPPAFEAVDERWKTDSTGSDLTAIAPDGREVVVRAEAATASDLYQAEMPAIIERHYEGGCFGGKIALVRGIETVEDFARKQVRLHFIRQYRIVRGTLKLVFAEFRECPDFNPAGSADS